MDHSTLFTIATEVLVHVRVFIDSRIRIAPIRAAQQKKRKKNANLAFAHSQRSPKILLSQVKSALSFSQQINNNYYFNFIMCLHAQLTTVCIKKHW